MGARSWGRRLGHGAASEGRIIADSTSRAKNVRIAIAAPASVPSLGRAALPRKWARNAEALVNRTRPPRRTSCLQIRFGPFPTPIAHRATRSEPPRAPSLGRAVLPRRPILRSAQLGAEPQGPLQTKRVRIGTIANSPGAPLAVQGPVAQLAASHREPRFGDAVGPMA
jgi:hypothetical protein